MRTKILKLEVSVLWSAIHDRPRYSWRVEYHEDGGVTKNNPSKVVQDVCKMALEVRGYKPEDFDILLLSLSTGELENEEIENYEHLITGGLFGVIISRLKDFPRQIALRAKKTDVKVKKQYIKAHQTHLYFRPKVVIDQDQIDGMDNSTDKNVISLIQAAKKYIYVRPGEYTTEFERLLKELERADFNIR